MHVAIETELKRLDEIRAAVLARGTDVTDVEAAIKEKVPNRDPVMLTFETDQVRISEQFLWGEMYVQGFSQVQPVIEAMKRLGHKLNGERDDFAMDRKYWLFEGDIIIDATLTIGTAECQKVKTGIREEPVYAWECVEAE